MNILAHLHQAFPHQRAGAETMLQTMGESLVKAGHKFTIIFPTSEPIQNMELNGVKIERYNGQNINSYWEWSDVVLTHLKATGSAINKHMQFKKPLCFVAHNHERYNPVRVKRSMYIIYNSQWLKDLLEFTQPSVICRPLVNAEDFRVKSPRRKHITLCNVNPNKGGYHLIELAKRMPEYDFLGVQGYGEQIIDESLPNLHYMESQRDIKEVLKKTKILIMPSKVESWGRMAHEAMASRIPVIANPTPGLKECIGAGGFLVEPKKWSSPELGVRKAIEPDLDQYEWLIRKLMTDKEAYQDAADAAEKRALKLNPANDLHNLERFLVNIVEGKI